MPADDSLEAESEVNVLPKWWEAKTDPDGGTYYFSHLTQTISLARPTVMDGNKERPIEHTDYNSKGEAARDHRVRSGGGGAEAARYTRVGPRLTLYSPPFHFIHLHVASIYDHIASV